MVGPTDVCSNTVCTGLVSRQLLVAEDRIRLQAAPCELVADKVAVGPVSL